MYLQKIYLQVAILNPVCSSTAVIQDIAGTRDPPVCLSRYAFIRIVKQCIRARESAIPPRAVLFFFRSRLADVPQLL